MAPNHIRSMNLATPIEQSGPQDASSNRTRVLVIDDDRKLCRLIKDYLEPMGYEISAIHQGPEGVEKAVSEPRHAVILDQSGFTDGRDR